MVDRARITSALLAIVVICVYADAQITQVPQTKRACCTDGAIEKQSSPNDPPLDKDQIQALVTRALENQLRDDAALTEYDRTEHVVTKGNGKEPEKETTARIVPTGTDVIHVELERNGKATSASLLDQQWRNVERVLLAESNRDDPLVNGDYERAAKKRQERAQMIEAFGKAFHFTWVGREILAGIAVVQVAFEPDPAFKPATRMESLYLHARGNVWIAESSGHLARLVADLTDDVSVAAGLIGKVYHGGRFTFEQAEVSPDVWLPTHSTYDFDGRKFVFSMSVHERVDDSDYRRIGPPNEALLLIRREHPGEPAPLR